MAHPTYNVVVLPRLHGQQAATSEELKLAQKFRSFRLHALKTAPEAFASSYERENARGIEQTFERLSNSKATAFVAISSSAGDEDRTADQQSLQRIVEATWLGMTALVGPQEEEEPRDFSAKVDPLFTASQDTHPAVETTPVMKKAYYNIGATFVDLPVRRTGLGRALIRSALRRAAAEAELAGADVECSILVDTENTSAKTMYEREGFVVVGQEMYQNQHGVLKEDQTGATERVALRMLFQGPVPE